MGFVFFFTSCESYNNIEHNPSIVGSMIDSEEWYTDANDNLLVVNIENPIPNELNCKPYNDLTKPLRPCTLEDINNDIDSEDAYEPILHVRFFTDTFATTTSAMNAVLKLKGNFSRTELQKSYSIKLDSKTDLFLHQRKFMLTKSQSDQSRIKNKLAFDLFKTIPNISSLKIQFMQLKINNTDYGIFSHIESIRKEYLVNRGWNKDDNLYNAVNFLFSKIPEISLNSEGTPVNKFEFNKILEIKNGKKQTKLLEMVDAIASTSNIDNVISKYFNRENYLTWLAINLILNNKDTIQHNFYLYNPLYSNTFYFLPWDYDGAWSEEQYLGKDEYGISVWWRSQLHRKFLSVKKNRDDLYKMADILREKYITDTFIQQKILDYEDTVRPFQSVPPDNIDNSDSTWLSKSEQLWSLIPANIAMYKSVIGHPMPFYVEAEYVDSTLTITWDKSVDLEGDKIVYDLIVSKDTNLSNHATNILEIQGIENINYSLDTNLTQGTYYIQVLSKEENNPSHYQISYEKPEIDGKVLYGILPFEVK